MVKSGYLKIQPPELGLQNTSELGPFLDTFWIICNYPWPSNLSQFATWNPWPIESSLICLLKIVIFKFANCLPEDKCIINSPSNHQTWQLEST